MGGITITKLETPANENAVTSIAKLQALVPDSPFALNRVYAPYRLGASSGGAISGGPFKPGIACTADRCFGAHLINWQPELASCARGIRIGIVDTGIDGTHPAFAGVKFKEQDFTPPGSAKASRDHGTGVFSVLAGLVPHAEYSIGYAFYAESNGGPAISDTTQMLAALNWLKERRVAIANLSFAGPKDPLLHVAVRQLAMEGVVIVAAAGNEGPNAPPSYPAAYKEVIAVTAVDRNLAPYRYANRGPYIDVAAPGVGIWTALPGRREGQQTGTSFAVPYVTAVLALNHPTIGTVAGNELAPKQRALEVLRANAMKLGGTDHGPIFGAGLVRAPSACPSAPVGVAVVKTVPSAQPSWEGKVVPAASSSITGWMTSTVRALAATGRN
jgi:subtilisin family serine protease